MAFTGNIFSMTASTLSQEMFILGVYNSRMTKYYWQTMFCDFKTSFPQVTVGSLSSIPVPCFTPTKNSERALHGRMVTLVKKMLELGKRMADEQDPYVRNAMETKMTATDRQIDQLVYELYGLTGDEIKLVESVTK